MAKYYYGNVLLPEIPDDVLAEYPYAYIRYNGNKVLYNLILSKDIWWYTSNGRLNCSVNSGSAHSYKIEKSTLESATEWVFDTTWTTTTFLGENSTSSIIWSNFDVPNGSATATDIYFYGSEPVPEGGSEPEEPEEPENHPSHYLIQYESLKAVADAIRAKTGGKDALVFPDGIVDAIAKL